MRILEWQWFGPGWAALFVVGGLLLVYLELGRPGWVAPGVAGLVLALVGAIKLAAGPIDAWGLALALAAAAALAAESLLRWGGPPGLAGAVLLMAVACRCGVLPLAFGWRWALAAAVAFAFSVITVVLGSAAWRGYVAKYRG